MNAIVGLCHFCEAHGPRPLFCTFSTDDEIHTTESSNCAVQCSGCTSVGPETVLVSRDGDGTIFCSRESVPNADVTAFLRQAALRSITCEVSWSKEGGVVYFSDTQGHVLSLMFHLKDTRARGLQRLFSIVVLMKDKMLLLNITPVLSEHMKQIAKELQQLADAVYDNEQSICSQRALRLNTGRNDFGQSRSLTQLTGDDDIYNKLHSHFTWMLRTGAITYSETLYTSQDLLQKLNPEMVNGTIFDENTFSLFENDGTIPLRELENLLTSAVFRIFLYCVLTGIKTEVKCKQTDPEKIIKTLCKILPCTNEQARHYIKVIDYSQTTQTPDLCLLEETDDNKFTCKWNGTIPSKCPTLMNKIVNAMSNTKFNDAVLQQHVKSLTVEWLGISKTIKNAVQSSGKQDAITKLKQVLGVTPHDESLVNYWSKAYC